MFITMGFKHTFLLLACIAHLSFISATSTDALSKIVITSTNATCVKNPASKGSFIFTYQDNVHVTFADQSTVTSDSLEITIDGSSNDKAKTDTSTPKQSGLSNFKQIMFKNNVCFTSENRKATARTAHFYLQDQRCILEGNVKICQTKSNSKDVPVTIDSQKAELNLATSQLKVLGTIQEPVSTTIVLTGHPALKKRGKKSKKKIKIASHGNTAKNTGSVSTRSS